MTNAIPLGCSLLLPVDTVNCVHNTEGTTPIYVAAQFNYTDVVRILAVFGANTTTSTTDNNWTPRAIASAQGHAAMAAWLGAVEAHTPLQIAAGCLARGFC